MDILQHLIELECSLHALQRQDPVWLDRVLHPQFVEIGLSGFLAHRAEIIAALLQQPTQKIEAEQFELQHLSIGVALITYRSYQVDLATGLKLKTTLRSSYWLCNAVGLWQLRFHQATPVAVE